MLTVLWIVGIVNAFNLMDNLDGACSTVAASRLPGSACSHVIKGHAADRRASRSRYPAPASGFLPWNLARPAKIFLGDGGSMPVGFLVAALAMATARHAQAGNGGLLVGALLAGLPILDVTLVSFSRTRRGVTLVTGGRDHLTHRILLALRLAAIGRSSARRRTGRPVLARDHRLRVGSRSVWPASRSCVRRGVVAILVLDTARWRPAGIAVEQRADQRRAREYRVSRLDTG